MYEDEIKRGLGHEDIAVIHGITCKKTKRAIREMVFANGRAQAKKRDRDERKRFNRSIAPPSQKRRYASAND